MNELGFYLKIWKFTNDPIVVSEALGMEPDSVLRQAADGGRPRQNAWILKSRPAADGERIEAHWQSLAERIEGRHAAISLLSKTADVVFTLWIPDLQSRPVLVFAADWVKTMAACNARFEVDYP